MTQNPPCDHLWVIVNLCSVCVHFNPIHCVSGRTDGESVKQTPGHVTLMEGATLALDCTYETTGYPSLFWYVQYPREGPQLLLKDSTEQKQKQGNKGFNAEHQNSNKSFPLSKRGVTLGDSAMYYCVLNDTVIGAAGGGVQKPQSPQPCLLQGSQREKHEKENI
uniref:Ig-like domain-containing protein n=1 Tax=Ornithorhynchus anatinus TaxID=9258 RepID=A0A6I8NL58_ORNAN